MTSERVRLPLTFRIPIPGKNLGKRPSGSWRSQRQAWNDAKAYAWHTIRQRLMERGEWRDGYDPHPAVVCDIRWAYWHPSHRPDPDNGIIRTAAARDALQDIGIVADDAHIQIGRFETQQVRRGMEGVTITIRELADVEAA